MDAARERDEGQPSERLRQRQRQRMIGVRLQPPHGGPTDLSHLRSEPF
jgi:hypothetical protein